MSRVARLEDRGMGIFHSWVIKHKSLGETVIYTND